MSLRFSIWGYWFELYLLCSLMGNAKIYFQIEYGHNSQNNLIKLSRDHQLNTWLKLGNRDSKEIFHAIEETY